MVPFLADAVSYAVSFGTVRRIRGRFRPKETVERKALWREVADGLQIVWQVPLLRAVLFIAPLVNFALDGMTFTIRARANRGARNDTNRQPRRRSR